jgi:hypothetical protein
MNNQFKLTVMSTISIILTGMVIFAFLPPNKDMPAPPKPAPRVMVVQDPLEEAVKSIGMVRFECNSGTFIIIGREHLENGHYLYHALTDHHIVRHAKESAQDPNSGMVAVQPDFHKPMITKSVKISFDWEVPARDWAAFSFEIDIKLPCITFASKEEFDCIGPFDTIYGVGSDNGYGLLCRTGNIASTNDTHPFQSFEEGDSDLPWYNSPEDFFRPMHSIWFGASGGGIFNARGHLIGVYEAFAFSDAQPVAHSAIAHKAYVIHNYLEHTTMLTVKD